MRVPILRGLMDRRILVNYRVDPDVLARVLPVPFRPQVVRGFGIAGICLIRLKHIRPRRFPGLFGLASENAAHRIAVEWPHEGGYRSGVYVPRRDTSSRLNAFAGGRLFPGVHHYARFQVAERNDHYRIVVDSPDAQTHIAVEGRPVDAWPTHSVFGSLREASQFFESGAVGFSASAAGSYDGMELRTPHWSVEPLAIERVESSFFESINLFPADTAEFDCALLMRGIDHEWHDCGSLCATK